MPSIDLLQYRDMNDPIHAELPPVGQDAGEWFGPDFAGLYVVAVGEPMHEGKDATVVLAHEHRPDLAQGIKDYVRRAAGVSDLHPLSAVRP